MLLDFHKVNWAAKEQHHPRSCEPSPNRGAKAEISWFCFLLFFLSAVGYGYEFTNGSFLSSDSSGQLISRFLSKRSCQGPQKFRQVSNLVKCHMLSLANPVPSFILLCSSSASFASSASAFSWDWRIYSSNGLVANAKCHWSQCCTSYIVDGHGQNPAQLVPIGKCEPPK